MTTPLCPCGKPATEQAVGRHRPLQPGSETEPAGPWIDLELAAIATCGAIPCAASAMLAAVDQVITDTLVTRGILLNPENIKITRPQIPGHPEGGQRC